MPYLYTRYLKEGAGACRSCRAKTWEPEPVRETQITPDEEMPLDERTSSPDMMRTPEMPPEMPGWPMPPEMPERPMPPATPDEEYFRNLYPLRIRRMKDYVREEVDRLEQMGGLLYDEFPDRVRMNQARDRILRRMRADSVEDVMRNEDYTRDVVETLLFQEIIERRCRRQPQN